MRAACPCIAGRVQSRKVYSPSCFVRKRAIYHTPCRLRSYSPSVPCISIDESDDRRNINHTSKRTGPQKCPTEPTATTRGAGDCRSFEIIKLMKRKFPIWFVANWSSRPSSVFSYGVPIMPALRMTMSTGASYASTSAAALRTDF